MSAEPQQGQAAMDDQPGERIVFRAGDSVTGGTFQGFDEIGRLLLERGGETVALAAGEVNEGWVGQRPNRN